MVGAQGHSGSAPAGSGQALSQRQGQAPEGQGIEEESVRLRSRSEDLDSISSLVGLLSLEGALLISI